MQVNWDFITEIIYRMRNKLTVTLEFWILVYVEYCLLLFHRFNTSLLEDTYCINHKVFHCSRPTLKPDQKKLAWDLVVAVWKSLCFYLSMICLCCSDGFIFNITIRIVLSCVIVKVVCECLVFFFCNQYCCNVSELFVFLASLCSYSSIFMWICLIK